MIQRRDRASLLFEPPGVLSLEPLNRDDTIQARIPRLPHFSHATRTDGREDSQGPSIVLPASGIRLSDLTLAN